MVRAVVGGYDQALIDGFTHDDLRTQAGKKKQPWTPPKNEFARTIECVGWDVGCVWWVGFWGGGIGVWDGWGGWCVGGVIGG